MTVIPSLPTRDRALARIVATTSSMLREREMAEVARVRLASGVLGSAGQSISAIVVLLGYETMASFQAENVA
jgi:hypothetical protein